jgi:SAM-dependent methyltransferase
MTDSGGAAAPDAPVLRTASLSAAGLSVDQVEDILAVYLRHAPLALSIREINRIVAIHHYINMFDELPSPILDAGCGDGFWWRFLQKGQAQIYGVDISESELAAAGKVLTQVENCDISRNVPFAGRTFPFLVGNCSLEHIPDITSALENLAKAGSDHARMVVFVPTITWALQGQVTKFALKHFPRLAMTFSGALNGFFQHWHMFDHKVWSAVLAASGWRVIHTAGLGGRRTEFLFRLFLPAGFLAFLYKKVFRTYPMFWVRLVPQKLLRRILRPVATHLIDAVVPVSCPTAYEFVLICEKGPASAK